MTFDDIMAVYLGSDAAATRALYARLMDMAPRGPVAVNLLRTCKASERAKQYRGRAGRGQPTYRAMAYDKKDWSIGELCRALVLEPDAVSAWGWAHDAKAIGFENVLYVDIYRAGQVSFHTEHRRDGPDYSGQWDGVRGAAPRRICLWVEAILDGREVAVQPPTEGANDEPREGRPEGNAAAAAPGPEERQETLDL